ncbi:MAG: lipocalin family protein [Bacteroidota bacterium]
MKKLPILLIFALLGTFFFSGCGKYDEGPSISLRSRTSRISGEWKPTKELVNSDPQTFDANSRVKIDKGGTVTFINGSYSATGTWAFTSNDEKVTFTSTYGGFSSSTEYTIKRLSNSELFMERQDGNDLYRFEYEKL